MDRVDRDLRIDAVDTGLMTTIASFYQKEPRKPRPSGRGERQTTVTTEGGLDRGERKKLSDTTKE